MKAKEKASNKSAPSKSAELKLRSIGDYVFKIEYSLKAKKPSKYATNLGYFHDLQLIVVAKDVGSAIETLKLYHDDGTPEGLRVIPIGHCVRSLDSE